MVLLDGQPAEAFERPAKLPSLLQRLPPHLCALPSLARLGVGRLVYHADFASLPAQARDMQRLHYSSARSYRSLRDEFAELPTSLAQARSFQNLGDRPLVVVTAARDAQAGWLPLQDAMATLSTNSSHRVVPYTHDALVNDQTAAQDVEPGDPRRRPCGAIQTHRSRNRKFEELKQMLLPFVIGIVLSAGVALFARQWDSIVVERSTRP